MGGIILGFPKGSEGPLQFEEDIERIRRDMNNVGVLVIEIMDELKKIRRMMAVHLGEATPEDIQKEIREDEVVKQKIREERRMV